MDRIEALEDVVDGGPTSILSGVIRRLDVSVLIHVCVNAFEVFFVMWTTYFDHNTHLERAEVLVMNPHSA